MCGIAGMINLDNRPVDVDVIRAMTDMQQHRGPDDQAFALFSLNDPKFQLADSQQLREIKSEFTNAHGAVGFNRLSIQDTSIRGRQPMSSKSGLTLITFNGEIYNAPELRDGLKSQGVEFRSNSDTEVILELYEQFGFEETLAKLNGMFAICTVDLKRAEILLARDHFGIKPFYIARCSNAILFASEAKSFLAHPEFRPELNLEGIDEYLLFRYVSGTQSLLKNVYQLDQGEWMRIDHSGEKRGYFWKVPEPQINSRSSGNSTDEFDARLRKSVRQQMISDVPLGCQLSGGVDSSVVNKFAADEVGENLNAFSVIFDDPKYSEENWVDIAARTAGVTSHKFTLKQDWYVNHFEKAAWHLDAPLNHPNTLGIMFLAANAKKTVTVLLSGEGADEVLGGYNRFFYHMFGKRHSLLSSLLTRLPKIGKVIRNKIGAEYGDLSSRFIMSSARLSVGYAGNLYPGFDFEKALQARRSRFSNAPGSTHLQKCLNYSMQTYLPEMLLRQDKMTMAVSLENRVPFLNHELVEYARQLPDSDLVSSKPSLKNLVQRNTKIVLKRVAQKYFDPSFVYRDKEGFAIPLRQFFDQPEFQSLANDKLLPGIKDRSIFDFAHVNKLWQNLKQVSTSELESLWVMLAFELWSQSFLRNLVPSVK